MSPITIGASLNVLPLLGQRKEFKADCVGDQLQVVALLRGCRTSSGVTFMDNDTELNRLADTYRSQGYDVVVRPGALDLPEYAKGFKLELLGRKGTGGVLVAVKRNRTEFAADKELSRYAAETRNHAGWRFDFAILEAEEPRAREVQGAKESSDEDVRRALEDADKLVRSGFMQAALTTAWASFEAAMRKRLLASGQKAIGGTMPRQMLVDLYSVGLLSFQDFPRLEQLYRWRSEISHGFAPPKFEPDAVEFLAGIARRLLEESEAVRQSA